MSASASRAQSTVGHPDSLRQLLDQRLTPWLKDRAAAGTFSGVVVVARNGQTVYSAAFGDANRAKGKRNDLTTPFNIGSTGKMFTAVAIGQLVDSGKLDLDAPVGRYLPTLSNPAIAKKVTIRELLNHTSGLGDYFEHDFIERKTYASAAVDYLPFFVSDSLAFEPGSRMRYSNAGFALLGVIIESVTGESYWDYVRKNVFERAGMTNASFVDARMRPANVAVGYARSPSGGALIENWDFIEQRSSPAGGAFASAPDLVRFSRSLWSGKLISAKTVDAFTKGTQDMGPGIKYALGFGDGTMNGWRFVGHNGGIPGASAEFMSFPEHGIDLVVLSNIDEVATPVAFYAGGLITAGKPIEPRMLRPPPGSPLGSPALPPAAPRIGAQQESATMPKTAEGRLLAAFLIAYNTGTTASLTEFFDTRMAPVPGRPTADRVSAQLERRGVTGALSLKEVTEQKMGSLTIVAKTEKGGDINITCIVDGSAPDRIAQLLIEQMR